MRAAVVDVVAAVAAAVVAVVAVVVAAVVAVSRFEAAILVRQA